LSDLEDLIEAAARSLEKANARLAEPGERQSSGGLSCVVSDLEMTISFGGMTMRDGVISVELPEADAPADGSRTLRFSVHAVPRSGPESVSTELPVVAKKGVSHGVADLVRAGCPADSIRVRFDSSSDLPSGSIISQSSARSPDGDRDLVTLVVSGEDPTTDKERSSPIRPGLRSILLEQVRGVGPAVAAQLATLGIRTVQDLSLADPRDIAERTSMSSEQAKALVEEAKEMIGQ